MAIRKMGYGKHQLSSHGLRSTFSTILNDSGLFKIIGLRHNFHILIRTVPVPVIIMLIT
jgi:hypothetical protein